MIYFISKTDLAIKDVIEESDWEINNTINLDGKSTVNVARCPIAEKGDYTLLNGNMGIIDSIETTKDSKEATINLVQFETLFDRKVILANESLISSSGMEDFIASTISTYFTNSSDTLLNLSYLNVIVSSHTTLNTSVSASVDISDGIYSFLTFLGNVKEKYDIVTTFEFNESTGKIDTYIFRDSTASLDIDATLTDIVNYEEVYSVDVIAKVTVLSLETSTQFNYYLKTDRTITTDVNDLDRAKGNIDVITCQTDVEAEQAGIDAFKSNSYQHNVSMDVRKSSKLYDTGGLYPGRKLNIKTSDNGVYSTFISKTNEKKTSVLHHIDCGNMKITLIDKLKGAK